MRPSRMVQDSGKPITSAEEVDKMLVRISAAFLKHGTRATAGTAIKREIDQWQFEDGPAFQVLSGPDLLVYRRPHLNLIQFGYMKRVDIRRGSPTAILALLRDLEKRK